MTFKNCNRVGIPCGGGALAATLFAAFVLAATPVFAQDEAQAETPQATPQEAVAPEETPGEAQSAGRESFETLDEIVVTATKRETGLMETPIAVTAVTQEALSRDGIQDIVNIGALIPNAEIGFSPSDSGVQVTVRGVSSNNFTEIGDPTVGVHVDGMYSPRPQGGLALLHDVERIEVLRGPQGTLFGRNSTAGTINVITARPEFEEFSGNFEVEYGKWDHKLARGVFNVPLSDTWAVRASFMIDQTDSWLTQVNDDYDLALDLTPYQADLLRDDDNNPSTPDVVTTVDLTRARPTGDFADATDVPADGIPNTDQRRAQPNLDASRAYGNSRRWAFRVNLLWEPNDRFNWMWSYDRYKDLGAGGVSLKDCEKAAGTTFTDSDGEQVSFACDHPQWFLRANVPGKLDMTIETWRSHITWDMGPVVVEHRLAIADQQRSQQYDGDGGAFADPDHPSWGLNTNAGLLIRDQERIESLGFAAYNTLPWEDLQLTTRWSNYKSVVNELQVKSNTDGALQWIVGFFDMSEKNAVRFDVEIPFCCGVIRPLAQSFIQPDRRVESRAAFAQLDYALNDRINLTLGYRITDDKKSDRGGANHETIGYWVNADGYSDPDTPNFWHESYSLIGVVDGWDEYYQSDDLDLTDGSLGENFVNRIPGTDNTTDATWSQGTWRVGADALLTDDLFVYGYIATGFKAGGFGDKVDMNGSEDGGITAFPYDPEEVITYELGFKFTALEGDLNLLGNVFFNDYTDLQRTTFATVGQARVCSTGTAPSRSATGQVLDDICKDENGNNVLTTTGTPLAVNYQDVGTLLTTNIAQAEIKGVEFEFDWWNPWEGGHIFGWVAYLDAEITEFADGDDGWFCFERALLGLTPCPAESANPEEVRGDNTLRRPTSFVGNHLPWSPEWSLAVNVEHSWWLENGWRISPFFSASWTDELFFNDNNFDEGAYHSGRESLATYGAALRFIHEESGWAGELYVHNLSDELIRNWADGGPGYVRSNFSPPRSYGVKVRREF